jgi:hypothetical protein
MSDDLRNFLDKLNSNRLPEGWENVPLAKKSYDQGFEEGYDTAALEYEKTLNALRRILDLETHRI